MHFFSTDNCSRYRVFEIEDPYLSFGIKVVVQQLEVFYNTTTKKKDQIWKPIGETTVGPKHQGNIVRNHNKKNSPEVGIKYVCNVHTIVDLEVCHYTLPLCLPTGDC